MAEIKPEDAPLGIQTYYDKGVAAMERNNLDYAMELFASALHLEPRLLEIRKLLHEAAFRKSKTAPIGKVAALKNRCGLMKISSLQKKDPLQALEAVEKLLCTDPLNLKIAAVQCACATAAGLPEAAIQTMEQLREFAPESLAVLEPLATLYRDAGRLEAEYGCRTDIARLNPHDAAAQKELKDSAARFTMDQSGWQHADSYRDVIKEDPPN